MIRTPRSAALLLTAPTVLGLSLTTAGAASAAVASAHVQPAAACTTAGPIQVDGFAFTPAQVAPGQSSTADLITTNCSNATLATTQQWSGQWLSAAGTVPPPGCPIIDPLVRSVTYAPGQQVAENTTYTVPVGCQADELAVTVRITLSTGTTTVSGTAYLKIVSVTPGS